MKDCILLLGHGSPKKDANQLDQVAGILHRLIHPGCAETCVRVAYMEFAAPKIPDAIKQAVGDGAKKVILHPFFLTAGQHVTKDIPEMIDEARAAYPGVQFIYTEPLGIHEKLAHIALERISAADPLAPAAIEKRSFDILSAEADLGKIPADRLPIVQRVIHATADFDFKDTLTFHPDAVAAGLAAIKAGRDILTDVEMVRTGINKKWMHPWGGKVICAIQNTGAQGRESNEQVPEGKTRAELGIEKAFKENPNIGIVVIGNAPTALLKTIELLNSELRTRNSELLVVGVPVGFVKAVESKALLAEQQFPFITALGRKGGTPAAVAIVNALLKVAGGIG
ncbi:MAG: precorrin-8X methylmutase [Nitrospirota bacterium]|nr:precorrin-8X methylmutase [Nitrospirota bacterium]